MLIMLLISCTNLFAYFTDKHFRYLTHTYWKTISHV